MKRLTYILFALLTIGCSGVRTEKNPAKLLGQKLTVPADLWESTHVADDGMKILVYYNAEGCTSCRLKQLPNWKELVRDLERMKRQNPVAADFAFVFRAAPDDDLIVEKLREHDFDLPAYYDETGTFERLNVLPEDMTYHCFLLNKNDRILQIGAPIFSPKLWERYKEFILRNGAVSS